MHVAINALVATLETHNDNMEMLESTTALLTQMAVDKETAEEISKSGALEAALAAMAKLKNGEKDSNEASNQAATLLEKVSRFNPDAILESGGVSGVLAGLNDKSNPLLPVTCAKLLDKITRTKDGQAALVKEGGIEAIMKAIAPGQETSKEMLLPLFRALERLAEEDSYCEEMKKYDAAQCIVAQLEQHNEDDDILREGGRLLALLASGDLNSAIKLLEDANMSDEKREQAMKLLAMLALQAEAVNQVVEEGGLKAIIEGFEHYNPKTQVAAAMLLKRVANDDAENVKEIVALGGIQKLIKTISKEGQGDALVAACIQALAAIFSGDKAGAEAIREADGLHVVNSVMKEKRKAVEVAQACAQFMMDVSGNGTLADINLLVLDGVVGLLVGVMSFFSESLEVQLLAGIALISMMKTSETADNAKVATQILLAKGDIVLVETLTEHGKNSAVADTVYIMLNLIIALYDKALDEIIAAGALAALVSVVYARLQDEFYGLATSIGASQSRNMHTLLTSLVGASDISDMNQSLWVSELDDRSTNALHEGLEHLIVFSLNEDLCAEMIESTVHTSLAAGVKNVVASRSEHRDSALSKAAFAVWSFSRGSMEAMKGFVDSKVLDALLKAIKDKPDGDATFPCLRTLVPFAGGNESKKLLGDLGVVDVCVSVIRTNMENPPVIFAAIALLQAFGTTPETLMSVVDKGGVRALNKVVNETHTVEDFFEPILEAFVLIDRIVAAHQDGDMTDKLKKQGTLAAVTTGMSAFPNSRRLAMLGSRILSKLLDQEGVEKLVSDLKALLAQLDPTQEEDQQHKVMNKLAVLLSTIGYLSLDSKNSPVILQTEAPQAIFPTPTMLAEHQASTPRAGARRNAYMCIGQMGSTVKLPAGVSAVEVLVAAVEANDDDVPVHEKVGAVEGIKYLAKNADARGELFSTNVVAAIVQLLKDHQNDEIVAQACLGALRALAIDEAGVGNVTAAGALTVAIRMLKDNYDHMDRAVMKELLQLLGALAVGAANVDEILTAGVMDTVTITLGKFCSDSTDVQPGILRGATRLVSRLTVNQKVVLAVVKKGVFTKIVAVSMLSTAYLADAECMEAVAYLAETCSMVESLRRRMTTETEIVKLLTTMMDMHPKQEHLMNAASSALFQLIGSDPGAIKQLIEEVNELLGVVEERPEEILHMNRLTKSLQSLARVCKMSAALQEAIPRLIFDTAVRSLGILTTLQTPLDTSEPLAITIGMFGDLNLLVDDDIVHKIVEAMTAKSESAPVLEKGSVALGKIGLQSWPLLKMVGAAGGVGVVCAMATAEDVQKQQAVATGLDDIQTAFLNSLDEIGSDPIGLRIFKELLSVQADAAAGGLLAKVAESPNGLSFLLQFLATNEFKSSSEAAQGRIVALIAPLLQKDTKVQVEDPELLAALVKLTEDKNVQLPVLRLLAACVFSIELVVEPEFAEHAAKVFTLLDAENSSMEECAAVLQALLPFSEESTVQQKLREADAHLVIVQVMEKFEREPTVLEPGIMLMSRLTKDQSLEAMGLTAGTMAFFSSLVAAYAIDPNLQSMSGESREETNALVEQMQSAFGVTDVEQLEATFNRMPEVLEGSTKLVTREDGTIEHEETNEVFSQAPRELEEEQKVVAEVARLVTPMKERVPEVQAGRLRDTVDFFKKHSAEPVRLVTLANALESLASNRKNRDTMAKAGLLEALASGLKRKTVDKEFVLSAVVLVSKFAKNKELKATLVEMEIIQILIGILQRFMQDPLVVEKVLLALSNLTFQNETAVEDVVKYSGIEQVKVVFNMHGKHGKVIRYACVLLVNVMFGSDHRKQFVGLILKEEVIETMQHKYKDEKLYIALARVVGNIACIDDHIRWFAENNGVKAIVAAMDYHDDNKDVQQVSIDVLGNFASLTEDDDGKKNDVESILDYIIVEGGAKQILEVCEDEIEARATETFLVLSGFKTLLIMANSSYLAVRLVKMGIVEVALKALQQFDTDVELVDILAQLLACISFYEAGVEELERQDAVRVMVQQVDTHAEEPQVVECILETLKLMSKQRTARDEIVLQDGVDTILKTLEANLTEPRVVEEALEVFIHLSTDEAHATKIGQSGMRVIFNVFKEYKDDPERLVIAYRLLGLLAFAKENLTTIVQYQGHELLINSIVGHPENTGLVTRSVKTLDNISMASTENSTIVAEAGGGKVLQEVLNAYSRDGDAIQLVEACKSALLSMKVVRKDEYGGGQSAKLRRAESFNKVQEVTKDPLKDYRAVLQAGSDFKVWSGSSYKKRYVRICKLLARIKLEPMRLNLLLPCL